MLRSFVALFTALVFTLTSVAASARPMEVAVFEASAYAEARDDAAVVRVLIEGTPLSAAEEPVDGWVRVRLDSGQVAWMHERDLKAHRPAASVLLRPEPERPAPTPAPRPSNARIYVKDLDHLSELVSGDPVVAPMAQDLVRSDTVADVAYWGGLTVGGAAFVVGAVVVSSDAASSYSYDRSEDSSDSSTGIALMVVGASVICVALLVGLASRPDRDDLLDVINAWNGRHPDDPFTFDR